MAKQFSIYRGLQKPLIWRGFQGKFIAWGLSTIILSLILLAVLGSSINMLVGVFASVFCLFGGLMFTLQQQKKGLHFKIKHRGVFQFGNNFKKLRYDNQKKKNVV